MHSCIVHNKIRNMLESKCSQFWFFKFEHLLSDLVVCPPPSVLCWSLLYNAGFHAAFILCLCFYCSQHLYFKSSSLSDRCIMGMFIQRCISDRPWSRLSPFLLCLLCLFLHCHPLWLSFHIWLLFSNDFSRLVAEEYLHYFNFTEMTLDQALRSAH